MLLKEAKQWLETALQSEQGTVEMERKTNSKLHCREQLLAARCIVNPWESPEYCAQWQPVINQANADYPEWSPLANADNLSLYKPEGVYGLSWGGSDIIFAEDQLLGLVMDPTKKEDVHPLVGIAWDMYHKRSESDPPPAEQGR